MRTMLVKINEITVTSLKGFTPPIGVTLVRERPDNDKKGYNWLCFYDGNERWHMYTMGADGKNNVILYDSVIGETNHV